MQAYTWPRPLLGSTVLALSLAAPTTASVVRVPGHAPNIQAGVNLAGDGDVVLVLNGIWRGPGNRDIDFGGRNITVRSADLDPTQCIIDCLGEGRGFVLENGETNAVIEGFTIKNGFAGTGGGIYIVGDCPDSTTSVTISRCIIENNIAVVQRGGGIAAEDCADPVIIDCLFVGNEAPAGGGLSSNANSDARAFNCVFSGNVATQARGGAVNSSNAAKPVFTNCTFSNNVAAVTGGAIYSVGLGSEAVIRNGILWENLPNDYGSSFPATVAVSHSIVEQGAAGTGNVATDPKLVDPLGPDAIAGTNDDDLRVKPGSPAIDAGDNTVIPPWLTTELAGLARFVDVLSTADGGTPDGNRAPVDMGAYELPYNCPANCSASPDNVVDVSDLLTLLARWGLTGSCDLDGNDLIDVSDLLLMLAAWGECE